LSTLLEWHCKFPVSDSERRRNDKVHSWQGNRNFAIDHPEFVESIWNFECPQETPKNPSVPGAAGMLSSIGRSSYIGRFLSSIARRFASMLSSIARRFANLFGSEGTKETEEF
jgi:hypothetical protein